MADIAVAPAPEGALITYWATIIFHGAARLADPLLQLCFSRLGERPIAQIARILASSA